MAQKTKTKVTKKESIWKKILTIAICIIVPVAIGGLSALITGDAMSKFGSFNQPPLAPPAWLFPVAWTILYILMGLASYFVMAKRPKNKKETKVRNLALIFYSIQLIFNFVWSPIFFLAGQYYFALAWLIVMYILIILTMIFSAKRSKLAFWFLVPYILWCSFAMYLNLGIAILN